MKIEYIPEMTRNKELLPHPLGPVMRRCMHRLTSNDNERTMTSPFGVMTGTSTRRISFCEYTTSPRADSLPKSVCS